eukprot:g8391.t1
MWGLSSHICRAFKGLILAAERAAEADENLRELIAWCAFLTEVLLQHGKEENALGRVMEPLNAFVPQNASDLPPAFVERNELVASVTKDLVGKDRATDEAHVLRGIPGGGKTVVASSVVRCDEVRTIFKDGIFWVQVGQVGTGNPTALLKGLAEDLAHAPSNRPHTVPHEFRDAEHVIGHLEGVLKQGNLRCLVILDDVWDPQIVPLVLRRGFHCLVTTRDVVVVPRSLRGTCTPVDMLTENEALELLQKASGATSYIPRDEGLKVADDCGFLPLPIAIIGAMGSSRIDPHSPETWRGVHAGLVEEPTLVQDPVERVLAVSFGELNEKARKRFRKLGVLVRGVRVPVDMVAHLWEQLHTQAQLRRVEKLVRLVTSRQAKYLGTISVLEGYARSGESSRGFYALMALWTSVENLSGDQHLEVCTYGVSLKALEGSEPTADVAYMMWAAGILFELQGKYEEAEPLYKRSLASMRKCTVLITRKSRQTSTTGRGCWRARASKPTLNRSRSGVRRCWKRVSVLSIPMWPRRSTTGRCCWTLRRTTRRRFRFWRGP